MAKLGTDGALDAAGCSRSGSGAAPAATDDAALVSVGCAAATAGGTFSED